MILFVSLAKLRPRTLRKRPIFWLERSHEATSRAHDDAIILRALLIPMPRIKEPYEVIMLLIIMFYRSLYFE